jgi:flagellar basal body-associated protein FliL
MNKKLLISVLVLLILGLAGYYLWFYKKSAPSAATAEQAVTDMQKTVESINQNVTEGVFGTTTANPMENVPNVNPYKNTNPFSDMKTNPFQ